MARPWPFTLLLTSIATAAAAVANAPQDAIGGGVRFRGGATAWRRTDLGGRESATVRWTVTAFSAAIASGSATVSADDPRLSIALPAVRRRVPATLTVDVASDPARRSAIEVYPPARDDVATAFGGERVCVVAPKGALSLDFGKPAPRVDVAETPGALSRSPARLVLLAGGRWDVTPFLPTILERARDGARVLALGPDGAPWLRPSAALPAEVPGSALLADLGDDPLSAWGEPGVPAGLPLAPPLGNHEDLLAGLVRDCFVGKGRVLLVGLRVAERLEDEPLAEILLARLVRRLREDPPPLDFPREVVGSGTDDDATALALFGEDRGFGPAVVTSIAPGGEAEAKAKGPVLVAGPEASLFLAADRRIEGPGTKKNCEFLRFATACGVRIAAPVPWRTP